MLGGSGSGTRGGHWLAREGGSVAGWSPEKLRDDLGFAESAHAAAPRTSSSGCAVDLPWDCETPRFADVAGRVGLRGRWSGCLLGVVPRLTAVEPHRHPEDSRDPGRPAMGRCGSRASWAVSTPPSGRPSLPRSESGGFLAAGFASPLECIGAHYQWVRSSVGSNTRHGPSVGAADGCGGSDAFRARLPPGRQHPRHASSRIFAACQLTS